MKKIIFVAAFLLTSLISSAQILAGKWFGEAKVGVNSIYSNSSVATYSTESNVLIMPSFGKFINNNTAFGLGLLWEYSRREISSVSLQSNRFGLSPNYTQYKFFMGPLGLYGRVDLPLTYTTYGNSDVNSYGVGLGLTPGVVIKGSDRLLIEIGYYFATASFQHSSGGGVVENQFSLDGSTSNNINGVNIGMRLLF